MNTSKLTNILPMVWKSTSVVSKTAISILLVVGLFTVAKTANNLVENMTNMFSYQVTKPEVNDPHLIVKQINAVSELTTSVFVMDSIVPTSSSRKLGNLVLGKTKMLYVGRGEVKAGLDLSKMTTNSILIDGDTIMVRLPAPEILDTKVDVAQSQVYDYDRGFLNLGPDVAPELQTKAQRYTLTQIKKTACEQDILDKANDKAVTLVTGLMTNAGYEEVKVLTTESKVCI